MPPPFPTSRRSAFGLVAAVLATPNVAAAQEAAYPSRPVRLLVPFPPGGAIDLLSRALAEALAPRLGQAVPVENRAGAGGNVAAEALARSVPDGHTLLVATIGVMAVNRHIYPRLPFDPEQDYVLYCHHGVRSLAGAEFLRGRGLTRVANLTGGIDAWSVRVDPAVPRY